MAKIIGVGVDIELVSRFKTKKMLQNPSFLKNIYSPDEIKYCMSKVNKSEHLAGRFAAKEAVLKSISTEIGPLMMNQIVILPGKSGKSSKPSVKIIGLNKDAKKAKNISIHISISHTKKNAIAFAVAVINDK